MAVISRSAHQSIRYLTSSSLEALYAKLRTVLGEKVLTFFAKPERRSTETIWYSEFEGSLESYLSLSDDDKDAVGDNIEDKKTAIVAALAAVPELKSLSDRLFVVPSAEQIHVYRDSNNQLVVVLSQWACSKLENTNAPDPISFLVNRRNPNRSRVVVRLRYSNGADAANQAFTFEYGETVRQFKTDSAGLRDLGNFKNNVSFQIYDLGEGTPRYLHEFTVMPDQAFYEVVFPLYSRAVVTVLDQNGKLCPDTQILIDYEGNQATYSTDSGGKIEMSGLEVGKVLTVAEAAQPDNRLAHTLLREDNLLTLKIHTTVYSAVRISVQDETGQALGHYPLHITVDGQEKTGLADEHGLLQLSEQPAGTEVAVRDGQDSENVLKHSVVEGENEIVLIVKSVSPKDVTIKLINHKNQPLPGIAINFSASNLDSKSETNEQGLCHLPLESFTHGEQVKAEIRLPLEKGGKKSERVVNKKIRFKSDQLDYTIKLRRINWWWLLLLLPLLLLIQCEKTIYVKTIDAQSKQPSGNIEVNFNYESTFLYDNNRFFPKDWVQLKQSSSSEGVATFSNLRYSVYSYLFRHFTSVRTFAVSSCYASDTLTPFFHQLGNKDTITLFLEPAMITMDFMVIDKEDNLPLPDANVNIISELNGKQYTESATSGPDGRVIFNKIPKCGKVRLVRGEEEGYLPDSMEDKSVSELLKGAIDQSRVLKLTPKKGQFSFFVVDCKTKKPIANASVTIEIDYNGRKTSKTKKTNVDGKGKGFADDYLKAKIRLGAKAPYYKPGELPGVHSIEEFIDSTKYPEEKRTFCLVPEENCIDFKNIDEKTGNSLGGVKNIVTIRNGGNTRTDTVISIKDGSFPVCSIVVGDVISIISQYPPDYEDNTTKIKDADGTSLLKSPIADRTIPLKPREVELTFRTIDARDNSLVDNAELKVIANGIELSNPRNSGNGEFKVKALYSSVISIVADKADYERNDTKVFDKAVRSLMTSGQSERDIPLKPSPKVNVTIKIININSRPDEIFDLIVNGKNLGTIIHNRASLDVKEFSVALSSEKDNEIVLDLSNEDGSQDTGSQITIEPGNFHIEYSGNDISYYFVFNASKNEFVRVMK